MKQYVLKYSAPAPEVNDYNFSWQNNDPNAGWEKWSLPIGCSHFGASVFGRIGHERINICENSLVNPYIKGPDRSYGAGGTRTFGDIIIDFNHDKVEQYERYLDISDAIAGVKYSYRGIEFKREYFCSYPDKVLVIKLDASKKGTLDFIVAPTIHFVGPDCIVEGDGCGRTGDVYSDEDQIVMRGKSFAFGIIYEGRIGVSIVGGNQYCSDGKISVKKADSAVIYFTCGTNFQMKSRVYTENDYSQKLTGFEDPHEMVQKRLNKAIEKGYEKVRNRHINDYHKLFDRVELDMGQSDDNYTDVILDNYKKGKESRYLEELLFQYGRYLLIESSRKDGYPANLQGTWNAYDSSPWEDGYTHDINTQMNYWPSGPANLSECFFPYIKYNKAYYKKTQLQADSYILQAAPEKYFGRMKNGWFMGATATMYETGGVSLYKYSGPGTAALTSILFWDHYDYTQDREYLRKIGYPRLLEASRFLSKTVIETEGKYLAKYSLSPEQIHDNKHYLTHGCAFDQQMIYENYKRTLQAAQILGIDEKTEPLLKEIKRQIDKLDPVQIGLDGQIKEYREEQHYGEIGEYRHRHISHLMGLYPGSLITKNHKSWIKGAKVALTNRSDKSTGWATAHRMLCWARTGDGKRTFDLLRSLIVNCILPNMWDTHPPFMIDGNFGATAGICEMLLQSHEGYIEPIPSIPDCWKEKGSYSGLVARGGFEVSCTWQTGVVTRIKVKSRNNGVCKIKLKNASRYKITAGSSAIVDGKILSVNVSRGETVLIET
ncbi:MAG: glycoside hydrolase family 95 protein [Clostridiales bacterium]|nr:glycoside hydrolase family 95 protein [Clostridiales bacterium]